MLHKHFDNTDLCSPILLCLVVLVSLSVRSLLLSLPLSLFLKEVQKVMRKGEEEVLHKSLVVRAIDWETADFSAVLSLCNFVL